MFTLKHIYIGVVWLATVISAVSYLHYQEVVPAPKVSPPQVPVSGRTNTLLMLVNPQCPCTPAALQNLEQVHAKFPKVQIEVCLVEPAESPDDFLTGPASKWQSQHRWAKITLDPLGVLAQSLGAVASGHTFYFDPHGKLKFSGGITRARGVSGDATGYRDLVDSLRGRGPFGLTQHDVFGCTLL